MHNRHITWRFGAELQPVCREQDVELSSIVLVLNFQVMTFGICVPKRQCSCSCWIIAVMRPCLGVKIMRFGVLSIKKHSSTHAHVRSVFIHVGEGA